MCHTLTTCFSWNTFECSFSIGLTGTSARRVSAVGADFHASSDDRRMYDTNATTTPAIILSHCGPPSAIYERQKNNNSNKRLNCPSCHQDNGKTFFNLSFRNKNHWNGIVIFAHLLKVWLKVNNSRIWVRKTGWDNTCTHLTNHVHSASSPRVLNRKLAEFRWIPRVSPGG